jgi:hypothetical protein
MKPSRALLYALLACLAVLPGCATTTLGDLAREEPAGSGRYVRLQGGEGVVRAFRGGRPLDARRGAMLQPGDEIETAPNGAAVIRFANQGEVLVTGGTRVRIGSLEVLFGRIIANVRGLFNVTTEGVVAGVEGTQFLVEAQPRREVRVVVADGTVVCRPRDGKSWAPVRLRPGEALSDPYGVREPPRVGRASPAELDEIRRAAQLVSNAPGQGYCCDGSRVFPSLSNQCGGQFRWSEAEARQACADLQPGYCCVNGRLSQTNRGGCYGQFFTDASAARRACVPPQQQPQQPQQQQPQQTPPSAPPSAPTAPPGSSSTPPGGSQTAPSGTIRSPVRRLPREAIEQPPPPPPNVIR